MRVLPGPVFPHVFSLRILYTPIHSHLSFSPQIPSDEYDEGLVAEEMQPGFTCNGKLVRAAYVMVSSGPM